MTEAKERKKAGIEPGADTWREDLDTRSAICARTVPVLEQEAKILRESLAAVSLQAFRLIFERALIL